MSEETVIATTPPAREQFQFTGQGGEYFRIWIVNLLLSIVTLGIYSAWAKVRREQYFHRNTSVGGSTFDYHGQPLSILKGRALVVALFFAYQFGLNYAPLLAGVVAVLFLVMLPWILCQAVRFRTYNTSWRGIRMGFAGKTGAAAFALYLRGLAIPFTLGFAYPWWKCRLQQFIVGNLRMGSEQFKSELKTSEFYGAYLIAGVVMAGFGVVIGAFLTPLLGSLDTLLLPEGADMDSALSVGPLGIFLRLVPIYILYVLMYVAATAIVHAGIINATFNKTQVGENRFVSTMRFMPLAWIMLRNLVLIIITMGLYAPYAKVRLARYRAETMALDVQGDLDRFSADGDQHVRAIGDEAASFMDIDLGF